eukprot:4577666-Alexandrium_andersonii.AAC.1
MGPVGFRGRSITKSARKSRLLCNTGQVGALALPQGPARTISMGRPPSQRLTGSLSEPPPNGHRTTGEDARTQKLGDPRSGAPSRC